MALTTNKVSSGPVETYRTLLCRSNGIYSFYRSTKHDRIHLRRHLRCVLAKRSTFLDEGMWMACGRPVSFISPRSSVICQSTGTHNTEAKDCLTTYDAAANGTSLQTEDEKDELSMMQNSEARNDIVLLSRGIRRLDARARQDVAFLGTEFLKLDARAREDTERIDRHVKKKAKRLHHIASILKDKAQSKLKAAADEHWSDGALEILMLICVLLTFSAKQRAMEDALMALEFVKNIHDMMVSKMDKVPQCRDKGSLSMNDMVDRITLEKNGKALDFFPGEVSTDRITAIQEVYRSMASALSEADGIDYTDPEELELLIATLIDLDAMDGKSSVSLWAECSSSPDVSTRQALANALAAAPSMWTLGNAGMGALQRLAEDSNPAIAAAASKAIYELKKQWKIRGRR
ncbi:putative Senescence-associated protein [Quillaja saponaria]|uniref:Senescence-associated protein n=1 Tax=Quillaja saponaria TaxID=32244 RepID=A0AAD7LL03_QUISA|nr:putative Senescence-associated protein [Quillaja saponaria]